MKETFKKVALKLMQYIPACAALMLLISSNSTGCFFNHQPDPPKNLKQYRKF